MTLDAKSLVARHAGSLRLLLALSIVAFLFWQAGLEDVLARLKEMQAPLLGAAFLMVCAESLLKVFNWRQLLIGASPRPAPLAKLSHAYLAGCFLGAVVPSSAGTDAMRALYSYRSLGGHLATHGASVVMLNIMSWLAGCGLGLISFVFLLATDRLPGSLKVTGLFLLGVTVAIPATYQLLKYRRAWVLLPLRRLRPKWYGVRHALRRVLDVLLMFERAHVRLSHILLVAAAAISLQALTYQLTAAAVGVSLPWTVWLIVAPLSAFMNLLPISVAGFGGTQVGHLLLLSAFGVTEADALIVSALMGVWILTFNLGLGGLAFVLGGSGATRPSVAEASTPVK